MLNTRNEFSHPTYTHPAGGAAPKKTKGEPAGPVCYKKALFILYYKKALYIAYYKKALFILYHNKALFILFYKKAYMCNIYPKKDLHISPKKPCISTKDPCSSWKEPCMWALCIDTKSLCILKEPDLSTKEPCSSCKEPSMSHKKSLFILTARHIPKRAPYILKTPLFILKRALFILKRALLPECLQHIILYILPEKRVLVITCFLRFSFFNFPIPTMFTTQLPVYST